MIVYHSKDCSKCVVMFISTHKKIIRQVNLCSETGVGFQAHWHV